MEDQAKTWHSRLVRHITSDATMTQQTQYHMFIALTRVHHSRPPMDKAMT